MKKDKLKTVLIVGGLLTAIVILMMVGKSNYKFGQATVTDPTQLPGIQTSDAPWTSNLDALRTRLKDIGFPVLSMEGAVMHIHQHLNIFIDGKETTVPAGIGIGPLGTYFSPIHVHDETGVIHVESPVTRAFNLGNFFDVWGVKLTADCVGGYCNKDDKNLKVYVNGELHSGDPRQIELKAHQEIVVAYGTEAELPKTIPATYPFPNGE